MHTGENQGQAAGEQIRRRGAMYVRMSTDNQKYSTENQADAIREYADRHKIDLVRTYKDEGKSGLKITGRDALQNLIHDVQSGTADYSVILVLDVTRWGRFQDADESAYYEYLCRRAGIEVQYVAEQFENDGSPVSTIVKGVKRAMAGEYSRELSGKVFAGQCRLIEMGFRQGGSPGYGLRRMMIDEQRNEIALLEKGQRKSIQEYRVILVPGPPQEIENVRWMYIAFIEEGLLEREIAIRLNERGVLTDLGRPWTRATVHEVLTNEKYIGNNIFNRISFKLKKRRVVNDPEMWVKYEGAFQGIVDPKLFYKAQGIISERSRRFSDDEMLEKLRALHERLGWLSGVVINETEDMPTSSAYASRFGSLMRAYELVGFTPDRDCSYIEINRELRRLHPVIVSDVIERIKFMGGTAVCDEENDLLIINNEIKISIVICRHMQTSTGASRWKIHLDTSLMPDITVAVRMDQTNKNAIDYYLLPALDIEHPTLRLAENNHYTLDAYRFDTLEPFFMLTEREELVMA